MDFPYQRILITGCGGAGKSTLARRLGDKLGLPVIHLDRLWWLPGWEHRTREEFDRLLAEELQKPAWIIDGDYSRTFPQRLERADLCIYLDVDVETCLEGIQARVDEYRSRTRPDMADGCPEREEVDPEFEQWVLTFNENVRPRMLKIMEESPVTSKIFTTREAAYAWLGLEL